MIPENIELDICLQSPDWDVGFPDYKACIETCFEQIVTQVPEARNFDHIPHLELSILLSDDQNIRELNKDYRGKDKATNVLSFPSLSPEDIDVFLRKGSEIPDFPIILGDIIFAYQTIKDEAREQGISFSDHFCHLCLHGMLHLLGYDHIEDSQADAMEVLEKKLLSKLSIDDPY
ncbi:MAG: rRNA maturation RNase YbeY [Alphaproteobacteria bacterium]|nr:MAG: rRNA maturation RNase YbeY [Alphaproteobacteria bacterium]